MSNAVHNEKVIEVLRKYRLNYLIQYFKFSLDLEKNGKIKIHKMNWKKIMQAMHSKNSSKKEIEDILIKYMRIWGVDVERKSDKKIKKDSNKKRVSNYRHRKKESGHKNISVTLDRYTFEKLNEYKKENGLSYAGAIEKLLM